MLTSTRNPTVRHIRKLQRVPRYRRETGLFVVEGVRLVEEVLEAGLTPETVLYTDGLEERGAAAVTGFQAQGVDVHPVTGHVMEAVSDTKTPQGLLAVLPVPTGRLPDGTTILLILDGVRDPGNLGTILRTAAAAGVEGVLLAPGSADPYQPKAVRSGMGAHFRVPVRSLDWDEIRGLVEGKHVFLADSSGETVYTAADLTEPLAMVIGGEAHGAGEEIAELDAAALRIPMPGGMESLNAAIAAGILVFEVLRQREA